MSFNVYITSHDLKYIENYLELKNKVERRWPEAQLHVIFAQYRPQSDVSYPASFHFIFDDDYKAKMNSSLDSVEIMNSLNEFSHVCSSYIYKSDLRFVQKIYSEDIVRFDQKF